MDHLSAFEHGVVQSVRLFRLGVKRITETRVQGPFRPQNMHSSVVCYMQITRAEPTARLITTGDFHPVVELLTRDIVGPGVEQAAKIIVPIASGELLLVFPPAQVRFDDVADPTEMDGSLPQHNVGVTDTNRLRSVVFAAPRPLQLPLGRPVAIGSTKSPLRQVISDVLHQDQFAGLPVRSQAAIRVLRKLRGPLPSWQQRCGRRGHV